MTSASELFYNRRSRFGRTDPDPALGYSLDRNNNRRHHHHHSNPHHRHDLDGCDPLRRSPHVRHISPRASSHYERAFMRLDQATNQHLSSNRGSAADTLSSASRPSPRPNLNSNDRLPGAVLLARARLLERLRGVTVSVNRHRTSTSPDGDQGEHIFGDDFRLVDAGDWGTETSPALSTGGSPFGDLTSPTERLPFSPGSSKKPPGLTQDSLDSLQLEIFSSSERKFSMESSGFECKESWDCSICLESFVEGDELTRLPCGHRFHCACLDPWVRTCGDCPYCRRGILS